MVRSTIACLLVLSLTSTFATPVAASGEGEDPYNTHCDGLYPVALVCAGADAGTNGGCDDTNQPVVDCWYTFGWNLKAHSPPGLPGGGRLTWSYVVEACVDGSGCVELEAGDGVRLCDWTLGAAESCANQVVGGATDTYELALGECVVVTATVNVTAEAWLLDSPGSVMSAYAWDDSTQGGAACYVDNGRD